MSTLLKRRLCDHRGLHMLPGLSPRRVAVLAVVVVVLVVAVGTVGKLLANFHTVVPGQLYRSAQAGPRQLSAYIDRYGIRSILNLRGPNPAAEWYQDERAVASRKAVRLYDVPIDSGNPPSGQDLRKLLQALRECPKPALLHCRSGIDRSSMAAAVGVLLLSDRSTPADALKEFTWRYGYMPWGENVPKQSATFYEYQSWLAEQGVQHSSARFEKWILDRWGSEEENPH